MKKHLLTAVFLTVITLTVLPQSTASENVTKFTLEAKPMESEKQIWVYLPADYQNAEKRYPVVYMHDAQNLFDQATSFSEEWKIDEYLGRLENPKAIIVGIEHGNEKRIDELTPFANEEYGGGHGAAYVAFIVETLKPHIDSTYRTLPDTQNTIIFGSSLGGLISLYAVAAYPEVFGKAGIFSPSLWYSEEIFNWIEGKKLNSEARLYFLAGKEESETLIPNIEKMVSLLQNSGIPENNIKTQIVPEGKHNESFWGSQFPYAYIWLLKNKKNNDE